MLDQAFVLRPPKMRSTNDGVGGHEQRLDLGTPAITWSTCWPQPDHVAIPHLRHITCRHIEVPPDRSFSFPGTYPLGYPFTQSDASDDAVAQPGECSGTSQPAQMLRVTEQLKQAPQHAPRNRLAGMAGHGIELSLSGHL